MQVQVVNQRRKSSDDGVFFVPHNVLKAPPSPTLTRFLFFLQVGGLSSYFTIEKSFSSISYMGSLGAYLARPRSRVERLRLFKRSVPEVRRSLMELVPRRPMARLSSALRMEKVLWTP